MRRLLVGECRAAELQLPIQTPDDLLECLDPSYYLHQRLRLINQRFVELGESLLLEGDGRFQLDALLPRLAHAAQA